MYLKLSFVSLGLLIPLCTSRSTALDKKNTCAWECITDYNACALTSAEGKRQPCNIALALCCHHSTATESDKDEAQLPVGNQASYCDLDCPATGDAFLVNPDDCTTFYRCHNGVAGLDQCPSGMVFDPTLPACDYPPEDGKCPVFCPSALSRHHYTATESHKGAAQFPVGNVDCANDDDGDDDDGDGDCAESLVVCNPGDTYLPNPDNRNSFYQCVKGCPVLQPCPAGLVFNPDLNVCDYP